MNAFYVAVIVLAACTGATEPLNDIERTALFRAIAHWNAARLAD